MGEDVRTCHMDCGVANRKSLSIGWSCFDIRYFDWLHLWKAAIGTGLFSPPFRATVSLGRQLPSKDVGRRSFPSQQSGAYALGLVVQRSSTFAGGHGPLALSLDPW